MLAGTVETTVNSVGTDAGTVTTLDANVTAALLANARPSKDAPVPSEIDCAAIIVPLKTEFVPRVAEVPTCQNTLEAFAPPARITLIPAPTLRAVPIWNIQTSVALPVRVTSEPVIAAVLVNLYKPVTSVKPPIFPVPGFKKVPVGIGVRPAALLYAIVKSPFAAVRSAISGTLQASHVIENPFYSLEEAQVVGCDIGSAGDYQTDAKGLAEVPDYFAPDSPFISHS